MVDLKYYRAELVRNGVIYFITNRLRKIKDLVDFQVARRYKSKKTFRFNKNSYYYLVDKYNFSWKNERTVEIPIAWQEIKKIKNNNILEVGNVLSHYFNVNYDIIDKYEINSKVKNIDVVDYNPRKKYDLIISISTLEHVGWEENPKEPLKIIPAIKKLKKLLTKNGQLFITLPVGYTNPSLNKLILEQKLNLSKYLYLRRVSADNEWRETNLNDIRNVKYNYPYNNSNAIMVGIFKNSNYKKDN